MDDPDEEHEEEEEEMAVESRFKFWPIGQGLFYTGCIDDGAFNFVYDCGSSAMVSGGKQALKRAINDYADGLKSGLNFMVVSHLDADHVNGIFELMARTRIDKLYLPYLGDSHRNELLIKLIIANAIIDDDEGGDTFEKKFNTLVEFYEHDLGKNEFKEQERRVWKVIQVGGAKRQKHEITPSLVHEIAPRTKWEFRMFSREISEDSYNKLNDAIRGRLKRRTIEQLLFDWNSSSDPMTTKLANLGELKKIYKDIVELSDINRSSIVLVHYPITDKEGSEIRIDCGNEFRKICNGYCDCDMKCYRRVGHKESGQKPITVLTGDADFDPQMRASLNDIIHNNPSKPFCILQAPHHGARKEWEALAITGDELSVCVIPFGYGNTYGHPSFEIKRDLREMNKNGWRVAGAEVTQHNKFEYRICSLRN